MKNSKIRSLLLASVLLASANISAYSQANSGSFGLVLTGYNQLDITPFRPWKFHRDDEARIGLLGLQWRQKMGNKTARLGVSTYWRPYRRIDIMFAYRPIEYNLEEGSYFGFVFNGGLGWDLSKKWGWYTDVVASTDAFLNPLPGQKNQTTSTGIQFGTSRKFYSRGKTTLHAELGFGPNWVNRTYREGEFYRGLGFQSNFKLILMRRR